MKRIEFIKTAAWGGLTLNLLSGKCAKNATIKSATIKCDETPDGFC